MAKGLAAQTDIEDHEFGSEVDRSIDILKESIRDLIESCGAVTLSTDCFNRRIEINVSSKGMKDVDMVMKRLKFALEKVFLDEKIPFKVFNNGESVCVEKSDPYRDFERKIVPRPIDKKGRISVGMLKFLREGFPVSVYANNIDAKVFVVISAKGDLPLNGYTRKIVNVEAHKRINISGAIDSPPFKRGWNVKIIVNGSYAIIVDDSGMDSPFATAEDYQRHFLPLMEALQ